MFLSNLSTASKLFCAFLMLFFVSVKVFSEDNKLEVHYINVGQGMSVLIIGPNGTKIIYDFGNYTASKRLIPYLESIGITSDDAFDYTILSHFDQDHHRGYKGLVDAGYEVNIANYGPEIPPEEAITLNTNWVSPSKSTRAGLVQPIAHNQYFSLGDGAELRVVAADGQLFDGRQYQVKNSNDQSISMLLTYGDFDMIIDGDIGGGKEECTGLGTDQIAMQSYIAVALIEHKLIDPAYGVEIMNVAHHGSHSSTTASYFSKMRPQAAFISVGNPNKKYKHPRSGVVDQVLLQNHDCGSELKVPPAMVFRTDNGSEDCPEGTDKNQCASDSGVRCGDILLTTDGLNGFDISCSGRVWIDGVNQKISSGDGYKFSFDEHQ